MTVELTEIALTENNNNNRYSANRKFASTSYLIQNLCLIASSPFFCRYKVSPASKDGEKGMLSEFDPFKERKVDHPTSDMDTLTHLLKASLGTGILAMPMAFSFAGLVTGIFATIATAIVCTHCAYVLVKCAHTLYKRSKRTAMSFSEVAEVAFLNGKFLRILFQILKHLNSLSLFFRTKLGTPVGRIYEIFH